MNKFAYSLFAELRHARGTARPVESVQGKNCRDSASHSSLSFFCCTAGSEYFFNASGPPLLLAAAEWVCRTGTADKAAELIVPRDEIIAELDVSPAGQSTLLLIEDAAAALNAALRSNMA